MIENIVYLVVGVAWLVLGYYSVSKSRDTKRQIYGIILLIFGAIFLLLSTGAIKLSS